MLLWERWLVVVFDDMYSPVTYAALLVSCICIMGKLSRNVPRILWWSSWYRNFGAPYPDFHNHRFLWFHRVRISLAGSLLSLHVGYSQTPSCFLQSYSFCSNCRRVDGPVHAISPHGDPPSSHAHQHWLTVRHIHHTFLRIWRVPPLGLWITIPIYAQPHFQHKLSSLLAPCSFGYWQTCGTCREEELVCLSCPALPCVCVCNKLILNLYAVHRFLLQDMGLLVPHEFVESMHLLWVSTPPIEGRLCQDYQTRLHRATLC